MLLPEGAGHFQLVPNGAQLSDLPGRSTGHLSHTRVGGDAGVGAVTETTAPETPRRLTLSANMSHLPTEDVCRRSVLHRPKDIHTDNAELMRDGFNRHSLVKQ